MITALLIDDDANLRNGMKGLLARYAPEIKILGEADSVETGVQTHGSRIKPARSRVSTAAPRCSSGSRGEPRP